MYHSYRQFENPLLTNSFRRYDIFTGHDLVATVGQILGLPEMKISEKLAGTETQTKPLYTGSGLLGQEGYQRSPIPGDYNVNTGTWQNTPTPTGNQPPPSGYNYDQNGTVVQQDVNAGGGGGGTPTAPSGYGSWQQYQEELGRIRSGIESGWNNFKSSMEDTSKYIDQQKLAQENTIKSQYEQGERTANTQRDRSLRDIADTIRNAFSAGNNYLGSLGAGDSSAANQYSFAINQQANKQTGNLNEYVNTQLANLKATYDQQKNQVAQWYAQEQSKLQQLVANGEIGKSQDLASLSTGALNHAMNLMNQINTNTQNQYNALLSWAANNSTNLGQLQQNIAGIPRAMGQMNMFGQEQQRPMWGGSPTGNEKYDIWGNKIPA